MGHKVQLIPPQYVKPFVRRGKNDRNDAEAISEAAARPDMPNVPVKLAEQQAEAIVLSARELLVRQRTQPVNAVRGHAADFGVIAAKNIRQLPALLDAVAAEEAVPCSRSCRQAASMGPTIGVRSSPSTSNSSTRRSNGRPRIAPGSIPKVFNTPRMWFDSRVVMPTSCALAPSRARARWASSDFTCTGRYHPVRMICARPSASFWSVLFICILSAALACRASRQVTLSSRARSSCTSQGVMGPGSAPILASSPACPLTICSICPGSVAHWPRQSLRPVSSTMQIAVSFCDSSKPTNRVIEPPSPVANRRTTSPGSRHHGWLMPPPRLPDVHTCNKIASLRFSARCRAQVRPCKDLNRVAVALTR